MSTGATATEPAALLEEYKQLLHFVSHRCTPLEHISAVKRGVWIISLGLGDSRGEEKCTLLHQVLQKSNVRLLIWQLYCLEVEVELHAAVTRSATSAHASLTAESLLGERHGMARWNTGPLDMGAEASFECGVANGSRVVAVKVNCGGSFEPEEVQIEVLGGEDTVLVLPWQTFPTLTRVVFDVTVLVTATTRFKISVRQTAGDGGRAVIQELLFFGVAPPIPPSATATPTNVSASPAIVDAAAMTGVDLVELSCDAVEEADAYVWSLAGVSTDPFVSNEDGGAGEGGTYVHRWSHTSSTPSCRALVGEVGIHAFVVRAVRSVFGYKDRFESAISSPSTPPLVITTLSTFLELKDVNGYHPPPLTYPSSLRADTGLPMLAGDGTKVELMLAGDGAWITDNLEAGEVASCQVEVLPGCRVTMFHVATLVIEQRNPSDELLSSWTTEMRIEELNDEGSVGEEIIPWSSYGTYIGADPYTRRRDLRTFWAARFRYECSEIGVVTSATRFVVSTRHHHERGAASEVVVVMPQFAGVAALQVQGIPLAGGRGVEPPRLVSMNT